MKQLIYWLIGEGKLKLFIYWLIGERTGRTLVGIWNWLWGIPVESGGKIAVEVAQESLESMQISIYQLAENQALLADQRGNEEAARLAMSRAIAIERLLPKISEQVAQAEQLVVAAKEKLYREREKLEAYQTEMQNMKALSEINEALETIAKVDTSFNLNSARSQFESAQAAVEGRYLKVNAQAELSESHTERMQADLDRLTLNDEISRRLANLKSEQS